MAGTEQCTEASKLGPNPATVPTPRVDDVASRSATRAGEAQRILGLMRWAETRARTLPERAGELALDLFIDRLVSDLPRRTGRRTTIQSYWYHSRMDALRRVQSTSSRSSRLLADLDLFTADECPPDEVASRNESQALLSSRIRELSQLERDALTARYFSELPFSRVASILGILESTARCLCWRATRKLREAMARSFDGLH